MAYRPYIWRKNNPEKRLEQKRREKVRKALRDKGIFPPVGEPLNEQQKEIDTQISNNDFSYWDSIKSHEGRSGGKEKQIHTQLKSPEYLLWYRIKTKCHYYNIPFNLEVDDIIIPELCEITSKPLLTELYNNQDPQYYTLLPIDFTKGFIKNNVKVVSVEGFSKFNQSRDNFDGGFYYDTSHYSPNENVKSILNRARKNAQKSKIEFNLETEDIYLPTHCKYLGVELSYNKIDGSKENYFSIDRIDSSKGYIKDNVQIISRLANTMKNNATHEQLITFSKNILSLHNS